MGSLVCSAVHVCLPHTYFTDPFTAPVAVCMLAHCVPAPHPALECCLWYRAECLWGSAAAGCHWGLPHTGLHRRPGCAATGPPHSLKSSLVLTCLHINHPSPGAATSLGAFPRPLGATSLGGGGFPASSAPALGLPRPAFGTIVTSSSMHSCHVLQGPRLRRRRLLLVLPDRRSVCPSMSSVAVHSR